MLGPARVHNTSLCAPELCNGLEDPSHVQSEQELKPGVGIMSAVLDLGWPRPPCRPGCCHPSVSSPMLSRVLCRAVAFPVRSFVAYSQSKDTPAVSLAWRMRRGMMKGGWLWAKIYSFFLLVGYLLVHVALGDRGLRARRRGCCAAGSPGTRYYGGAALRATWRLASINFCCTSQTVPVTSHC